MGRLAGRIWVTCTLLLISFIGFSSQLLIILPSYHYEFSIELIKLLAPFNLLLGALYWNYALCVTMGPGAVPEGWTPSQEQENSQGVEVKRLTGGPRWCRTCKAYKPPRAHHCRQCRTCVLKMDHHCPWVNNCIGHANYASFLRFLLMVDLACSYHLWMITRRAFGSLAFSSYPTTTQIAALIANYVACIPVLLAVGCFSLYHAWCVVCNTTTIESWEKEKVAVLRRKGKILEYKYPYHLGYLANVQSVLGPNPLLWFVPSSKAHGDGMSYQVGKGVDPQAQYDWPPRNPYAATERAMARDARERSRARLAAAQAESPFAEEGVRRRKPKRAAVSPYRDDYEPPADGEGEESGESTSEESDADEEDIPLSLLARHGRRSDSPPAAVRVRRGSEGYEVRPVAFGLGSAAGVGARGASEEWEEWEDGGRVSEGELDEQGDRMRRGGKYKVYERESSSGSDRNSKGRNSVDEFLEDHAVI